ncbi:MAG: AMP-binding protein [FCB group bacterium]|nr:AMP-binding protein [FCB group bacterium]
MTERPQKPVALTYLDLYLITMSVSEPEKAMTGNEKAGETNSMIIPLRFLAVAEKFADIPAVGMAGSDATVSYRELAANVRKTAEWLGQLKPLQPIGLLSENRPEWCKLYLGILAAGGLVVPIDPLLKKDELKRVFTDAHITKLIASPRYLEISEQAIAEIENGPELVNLESIPTADIGDNPVEQNPATDPDSPAVIIFTSGTTGRSKKVILTHHNILSDIDGVFEFLNFTAGDRFLSVLPLHHTFEATCGMILPLMNGMTVYYVRELNSREIMNGLKKHKINYFISVPLLYEKLYHGIINGVKKAPPLKRAMFKTLCAMTKGMYAATKVNIGNKLFASFRKKAGMDSIKMLVSGGAPLPAEISRNFSLMGFCFIEGYGLTESSPILTVNPYQKIKFGSVGIPMSNVEIKIDNPNEKGVGEILAKGPMITPGYQDNPEETAKLLKDGWLYTGDLGRLDEEGYLFIMGRKKSLIVSAAGKNIYPEEIEAELLRSPYIFESLVFGKMGETGREEVSAVIFPDFEMLASQLNKEAENITDGEIKAVLGPEIKEICGRMADYKRIKNIEYIRHEFEKTSTKKIKRHLYQK